jgi:23S rRNA pseudouridine1911/1915/1917 synthase
VLHFTATHPIRLDAFLVEALHQSRNQVAQLIKLSCIQVNSTCVTKPSHKLKISDNITVTLPQTKPSSRPMPIDFDVDILYEDAHILVINKPSNLTVHGAPSVKEPTLVDWLKHKNIALSTISGQERHGIVHRLDKGTSGAMVVAKTNQAHEHLSNQLQDKSMGRYYLALIDLPLKESMLVDRPIARNPKNRLKMGIVPNGKSARTAFAKLATSTHNYELIACKLFTGRTHQIRVHLNSISRHIVGDTLYGFKSKTDKIERIFLHAYSLYLYHPQSSKPMQFTAPLPDELVQYMQHHFKEEEIDAIFSTPIDSYFTAMDEWMLQNT